MCRLFALHAGDQPVSATFWLLDAPDSLAEQSHRIHAHSTDLAATRSVVIASEPMDDDAWRLLEPGELISVGPDLEVHSRQLLTGEPRHMVTLADLNPTAAGSQHPQRATR